MNILCFLNIASVLGTEVVHITFAALFIYPNRAGVFLTKLQRKTLDLPLYRKMFVPRRFSCKYMRIFIASLTRSNVSSLFGKIEALFKRRYTIDFLLKIFFLRQLIPKTFSKSICGKFVIS